MKKAMTLILTLAMLLGLAAPASAAHVSGEEAVAALETLGLVQGTGSGFEPERSATRAEALVMLLRLLGRESAAKSGWTSPFADGGWADSYIGYACANGLAYGMSAAQFGSAAAVTARDYLTMTLRALGYSDAKGDFTWAQSIAFADSIGLTHGEYTASGTFLREDLALVSYTALTLPMNGGGQTLAAKLYQDGVISAAALKATRLANTVQVGKPSYTAAEIHEKGASAVVYMEMYNQLEARDADKPDATGSGFFVTEDGVAVMTYHELDGYSYARATTLDGHRYAVTGVLYYDVQRDVAVVRVSRTDENGTVVRAFPYLDLGDSDALSAGDPVCALSNPLGLIDSVSTGVVSNRARTVDDPAYPCLQITAPIASGSSGGPLLNECCEVVGVLYGSYINGQNMNLAIPVNCLQGVRLTGSGTALTQVCAAEDAKKAEATITAERTRVTLHVGEEQQIMIRNDCPGQANIKYEIEDPEIASCLWGAFVTKQSVPLQITGEAVGETTVRITFVSGSGNEAAAAEIRVSVIEDS